jgi:hypothetical protein
VGNLATPSSVQKLQTALHAKAKAQPSSRFYLLYDKVYRAGILAHAYACCKANKGAAGVDEQEFADVEAYGVERWLGELAQALREEQYRPEAVRQVYLKKPKGKLRPLGIPTVRDRVCETAARLVLEPIFDAVNEVHRLINTGHQEVVDADGSGYFDSIAHLELMESNEKKTRTCRVPEETFDFLGYTFGRCYSPKTGRAYLGTKPSKKSIQRLVESIRAETHRGTFQLEATQLVECINRKFTGWANYFCLGPVTQAYRAIDAYTTARLRQWLCGKHQVRGRGTHRYPDQYLYEHLALIRLPWAKA